MASNVCGAHSVAETGLVCGRCEVPVCARCVVTSIVGTRCRTCAPQTGHRSARAARQAAEANELFGFQVSSEARFLVAVVAVGACVAAVFYAWTQGNRDQFIIRAIVFGGWLFSLSLHEFSHSLVAYLGGDRSIKDRGFLTLNPLKFMDPVYSVAVPTLMVLLGGIPLVGGRTLVDTAALRSRWWDTAVSIAGPSANLAIAILIGIAFQAGLIPDFTPWAAGFAFLAVLQLSAALFNMIPIPPLDGFGALSPHLDHEAQAKARSFGYGGYFLLIALFWTVPQLGDWFWDEVYRMAESLQIPFWDIAWGSWEARLWHRGL